MHRTEAVNTDAAELAPVEDVTMITPLEDLENDLGYAPIEMGGIITTPLLAKNTVNVC